MSQSTELMIDINVQDGASPKFKAIGQAAQNMGVQAEQAGGRAGGAFRRLQDAAKQNAMAIGLLTGSFGLFARAARDADRDLATLDRTYGDTADSLRDFGDELQRTTTFSNEQAVAAANVFGTLSRNYGLTADQIQNLIQVSADLAAVNGISLSDAAERVQAAIRGEAESAEALGLTMNETAIGLADVSAGMSEAEKAAYRYDALLKQAAFSTGAAAEQADTTAGKFTQLTNSIQDAGQDFVRFTGPLGQAVAGLSDASLEVGMAASGFAALAPVLKSVSSAMMGPAGIAIAAAAGIAAIIMLRDTTNGYEKVAEKATQAVDNLTQSLFDLSIQQIAGSELQTGLMEVSRFVETLGTNLNITRDEANNMKKELNDLYTSLNIYKGETSVSDFLGAMSYETRIAVQSLRDWNDIAEDGIINGGEFTQIIATLDQTFGDLVLGGEQASAVSEILSEIIADIGKTGVDTTETVLLLIAAIEKFKETGDFEAFIAELNRIHNGIIEIDAAAAQTNATVLKLGQTMTDAWTSAMDPLRGVYDQLEMIFSSFAPGAYEAQQSINGVTGAAQQLSREMEDAFGDPIATQQAINNFYATASAMEILNYELALAGDNQEAINEAYRMFAIRVRNAGQELDAMGLANSRAWQRGAAVWGQMAEGNIILEEQREGVRQWGEAWENAARGWTVMANGQSAYLAQNATQQMEDEAAAAEELAAQTAEAEQAFIDAAFELGGFNNALQVFVSIGAGTTVEQIGDGMVNIARAAYDAQVSVNALGSGFQTLVQNPINWGKQAQEVADWATSMMLGADGVNSLADLWGRGQIETITYNRGLEAQGRILDANADIQNDVARIQAKQLPVMADLIENQAKYIDQLADLDPANQTLALGYMDVTKAAQAQNLVMLAADAASGAYGQAGLDLATNLITAAAMADPVLAMMLEDLDLITQYTDENGDQQIRVNFPDATSLNKDIQELTKSIDALTVALGGVPAHVNSTVDVIYRVNGVPTTPGSRGFGFTQELATGGTVTMNAARSTPMFATAATGRTTLVGEAGPELVTLPSGSQVTSSPATMDRLRSRPMQGSGGGVYFYGPVTLQPASTDVESAIRREALSGSRGY